MKLINCAISVLCILNLCIVGCYDNVVTDYSVQLFPSTKASYSAGSTPVLTCQAVNTDPLHHPRWCKETESGCVILDGDETGAMDPASLNITYSFAESNCTWIAHLELKSFSGGASGTYTCYILGTNVKSNVSIELLEEAASAGWQCRECMRWDMICSL